MFAILVAASASVSHVTLRGVNEVKTSSLNKHTEDGLPRSWRVDQRQRDARQTSRTWEADELPVRALREVASYACRLTGSARSARTERRKLGVQFLCVKSVLQGESGPPVRLCQYMKHSCLFGNLRFKRPASNASIRTSGSNSRRCVCLGIASDAVTRYDSIPAPIR